MVHESEPFYSSVIDTFQILQPLKIIRIFDYTFKTSHQNCQLVNNGPKFYRRTNLSFSEIIFNEMKFQCIQFGFSRITSWGDSYNLQLNSQLEYHTFSSYHRQYSKRNCLVQLKSAKSKEKDITVCNLKSFLKPKNSVWRCGHLLRRQKLQSMLQLQHLDGHFSQQLSYVWLLSGRVKKPERTGSRRLLQAGRFNHNVVGNELVSTQAQY